MKDQFNLMCSRADSLRHKIPECLVVYSNSHPLKERAVQGKVQFVQRGDEFFGNGKSYKSKVVTNPSWMTVAKLANEMIHTTEDRHHVYLEGVRKIGNRADGILVYEFIMGS